MITKDQAQALQGRQVKVANQDYSKPTTGMLVTVKEEYFEVENVMGDRITIPFDQVRSLEGV